VCVAIQGFEDVTKNSVSFICIFTQSVIVVEFSWFLIFAAMCFGLLDLASCLIIVEYIHSCSDAKSAVMKSVRAF
jgi:hypothetical protein